MPQITEEDAHNAILQFISTPKRQDVLSYGYDVYLPNVMEEYAKQNCGSTSQTARNQFASISPELYAAAWSLCRRGILRPGVARYGEQSTPEGSAGLGFSITPFGRTWLKEGAGRYDYVPTEPGTFAQLLAAHNDRLGQAFLERSQEAVRCYGAHAYLGCCTMCGAAAESIVASLAIAKGGGDAAAVEKELKTAQGRSRIENRLTGSQPDRVRREFGGYSSLLKYWRDVSAHGLPASISDGEAYTSLALLLRFAVFASDHWGELTN